MSNKIKLKRCLIRSLFAILCAAVLFLALHAWEYHEYTVHFNQKLAALVTALQEQYPGVNETEILRILNSDRNESTQIFEKYGIDLARDSVIVSNNTTHMAFSAACAALLFAACALLLWIFMAYQKDRDKDLADITEYIRQINQKNYELDIDTISEDELSILKHEIYKTTVMLKEAADNSEEDRRNLKRSLEDISHQLKTPLTSILVMLDNLMDDPEMDSGTRDEFIRSIRREAVNINFLVQALLKLSKLDAAAIHFMREENSLRDLIDETVRNVSALCDLRNVRIEIDGSDPACIVCDRKWQIEALTNIVKNCVDHSREGEKVQIRYSQNSIYAMIEISDSGEGISPKDLPHIFERFYRGENAAPESIGIGLALSRTIINEDNGTVSVDSDENGTVFKVRYYTL